MTDRTVYYWELYCITDNKYEYVWSDTEPMVCPSNATHTISTNPGPRILDKISENMVRINEEETPTKGYFKFQGYKEFIPASNPVGNVTIIDLSWKWPVSLLTGWFNATTQQIGDEINVTVAENTIIGNITSNVNVNATTINVTNTVIETAKIGWKVNLFDGITSEDLGYILNKDTANNIITIENPVNNNFRVDSPTYVRLTADLINNFYINSGDMKYAFAEKKVGGRYIPADTIMRIRYKNNEGSSKQFVFNLEYLF